MHTFHTETILLKDRTVQWKCRHPAEFCPICTFVVPRGVTRGGSVCATVWNVQTANTYTKCSTGHLHFCRTKGCDKGWFGVRHGWSDELVQGEGGH